MKSKVIRIKINLIERLESINKNINKSIELLLQKEPGPQPIEPVTQEETTDVTLEQKEPETQEVKIDDLEQYMISDLKKLTYSPNTDFEKNCNNLKDSYENKQIADFIIKTAERQRKILI